ncbi:hypothetical protein K469DRAFT_610501 [Zopfia rhizophila CBS 207.26]|uniref:DNA/RNA-binding domain-containing protein n=1 Tax=Zopfia rhizophila CBS 207.26 TaxID=1314779 RepID=A0A6A6DAJ2_9PEZI|nr:hypothetical protein K469DRAFT_610501 [Zopfia rhizophila CBS 207.26]
MLCSEIKSIEKSIQLSEKQCDEQCRKWREIGISAPEDGCWPWPRLVNLHRNLLNDYYDWFLTTEHPSAPSSFRQPRTTKTMLGRMWTHGVDIVLHILSSRLPDTKEFMVHLIYFSYHLFGLLYETVRTFEVTWLEFLGHLGRYRTIVEDDDSAERMRWKEISEMWYCKLLDKSPFCGRLYSWLGILAKGYSLQQLYCFSRSLTSAEPFKPARILAQRLLTSKPASSRTIDIEFLKIHEMLFLQKLNARDFDTTRKSYQRSLKSLIQQMPDCKEWGVYMAIINIAGLFDYGSATSPLQVAFQSHTKQASRNTFFASCNTEASNCTPPANGSIPAMGAVPFGHQVNLSCPSFSLATFFAFSTLSTFLKGKGHPNSLPHIHCFLVFLLCCAAIPNADLLMNSAPWGDISCFLNQLANQKPPQSALAASLFRHDRPPLPEEYLMRGQVWNERYFPGNWFSTDLREEDRFLELCSTQQSREMQIMCLGYQISSVSVTSELGLG